MTTLSAGFESDLRDALLDDAEETAEDMGDGLKFAAENNFRTYAARQGYDIDHIWQDAKGPSIRRGSRSVDVTVEWPALTALFEYGVSPHTIEGNPLLAFAWKAPPEGTRPPGAPSFVVAESVNWGSVTGGIDESRAIRDALETIREVYGTIT